MNFINTVKIGRLLESKEANRVFLIFLEGWYLPKEASGVYRESKYVYDTELRDFVDSIINNELKEKHEKVEENYKSYIENRKSRKISEIIEESKDRCKKSQEEYLKILRKHYKFYKQIVIKPVSFREFIGYVSYLLKLKRSSSEVVGEMSRKKNNDLELYEVKFHEKREKVFTNPIVWKYYNDFRQLDWLEPKIVTKEFVVSSKKKLFPKKDTRERYRIDLCKVLIDYIQTNYFIKTRIKLKENQRLSLKVLFSNEDIRDFFVNEFTVYDRFISIRDFLQKFLFSFLFRGIGEEKRMKKEIQKMRIFLLQQYFKSKGHFTEKVAKSLVEKTNEMSKNFVEFFIYFHCLCKY